jgi:integrase
MATNIFKRDDVYWIRYTGLDSKQKRESVGKGKGFKDAELLLAKRKKEIAEGNEPVIKRIKNHTFEELAIEYYKWCERQRSFKSKRLFIKQLVDTFGTLQLRHITTMRVEQFQTDRINKGNKPATINRLLATLKHCIHKGYQWEMLSEETLKRVRQVRLLPENNRRLRYLSKDECKALINVCDNHLKPIVITALHTGCRKSEILNLKWDNVDLRHNRILLHETKNGERREVPINETLRITLQDITRRLDIPYVFYDSVTGKPYGDVKRSFNTACRRSGIKDFHFHDLRHTFASHLVMAGVDITTVSRLLGHKTLTMTLRYSHLSKGHLDNAVNALDNALQSTEKISTVKIISTKLAQFAV